MRSEIRSFKLTCSLFRTWKLGNLPGWRLGKKSVSSVSSSYLGRKSSSPLHSVCSSVLLWAATCCLCLTPRPAQKPSSWAEYKNWGLYSTQKIKWKFVPCFYNKTDPCIECQLCIWLNYGKETSFAMEETAHEDSNMISRSWPVLTSLS